MVRVRQRLTWRSAKGVAVRLPSVQPEPLSSCILGILNCGRSVKPLLFRNSECGVRNPFKFGMRNGECGIKEHLKINILNSEIRNPNSAIERKTMEAIQEPRGTSPESRATSFEPEILAYCCEHCAYSAADR